MSEQPDPDEAVCAARRALEGLRGFALLDDWAWNGECRRWTLRCRLSPDVCPDGPIPSLTEWYVLVDPAYPWGPVKVHPAKERGLTQTFHHQDYNGEGRPELPWREGDLCLSTSVRTLGRHGFDTEPYGVHQRLRWHVQRALNWLESAARGELVLPGEPFELPKFPGIGRSPPTVAFSEGPKSYAQWDGLAEACGLVDLSLLRAASTLVVVRSFRTLAGKVLFAPSWGEAVLHTGEPSQAGIWLRLPRTPVLAPWQAPADWKELRAACEAQGAPLDALLQRSVAHLRDGKRHILLLGFPIPAAAGDPPRQLHWQGILLPVLSSGTQTARGFRTNDLGYWQRDRREIIRGSARLDWLGTENWHQQELSSRGRLPDALTSRHVLLLGAGALGSAVAELLVRAGVHRLTVMDAQDLEAGNLSRHTLTLNDLKRSKARSLAERLNALSPHTSVTGLEHDFPPLADEDIARVQESDIVLDCTGEDDLLHHLERFPWSGRRTFASFSVGFAGRRLFCFCMHAPAFPHEGFQAAVRPWLEREMRENAGQVLPREGTGCWHAVFPARADDVWIMAAVAVKHLEAILIGGEVPPAFAVYEQQQESGGFAGVSRVFPEVPHAA